MCRRYISRLDCALEVSPTQEPITGRAFSNNDNTKVDTVLRSPLVDVNRFLLSLSRDYVQLSALGPSGYKQCLRPQNIISVTVETKPIISLRRKVS